MKMIPLLKCRNLQAALKFYTEVLDFQPANRRTTASDLVVLLKNGDAELMLTSLEQDQQTAIAACVLVENVDALFEKYRSRGLDQSHLVDSPVHLGPVDQTWGTREFYVTDLEGNTLRFMQR